MWFAKLMLQETVLLFDTNKVNLCQIWRALLS
jgi:hypothetical protein